MNHIGLPLLVGVIIFGTPLLLATKPVECPKHQHGKRLAYSTLYPSGAVRCSYVPNIYGLAVEDL